jgi:hypothetical protein
MRPSLRWTARIAAAATISAALGGCVKPLFPEDAPRTQFETYDRMRARFIPLEEPDVFGTPRPALRARLGQP